MAPPAGDTNVIRRSIYQNSNTLVELLIKSKEPRLRTGTGGSTGGRLATASEPSWPAAVPLRRDGRPLSSTAHQLPLRPRTGRSLPNWQPAGEQEGRRPSPERPPAGRGGRQPAARAGRGDGGGGQRPAPSRAPAARGQPPQRQQAQGAAAGRLAPVRAAGEAEGDEVEHSASQEFRLWTEQLNKLVQDIRKRPATAHLRPLLSRLEETVRVPPVPLATLQRANDEHDPLRARLEEIQQENEELQRKFQTLSVAMREYQQQRQQQMAGGSGGGDGGGGESGEAASPEYHVRQVGADTELAEVKHQLAKYKKYAKELKKTKENLLNTIQAMEESHATELKGLKEEHETQIAQVLAQFTNETEMLVSFRADAEAVQRSLAQRVRENSELQRALAERDTEVERLASLNQTLHELALKQLQQLASSDLPSLSQLMTKLQSPSAGGGCSGPAQDGSGDGAARPAWPGGRDTSLFSLDVTEPLPPRPFPRDWADLSLASLVGSVPGAAAGVAAEGGEQRQPGDGDRGRRPPSGGAGDPPPPPPPPLAATSSASQRQVTGSAAYPLPQQHDRELSNGGTNQRLFGDRDQFSGGAGAGRPYSARRSDPVPDRRGRGDQSPDRSGRGDQSPDRSGRGDQIPDRSGRGDQIPDRSGRGDQIPDGNVRGDQIPDRNVRCDRIPGRNGRCDQIPDRSGRGDQRADSVGCGAQVPVSGASVGPAAPSGPGVPDQHGPAVGGGGDCRRPPPVGSQLSEEGFQRSLARLNERLSDLQQGISRAAQVLTP